MPTLINAARARRATLQDTSRAFLLFLVAVAFTLAVAGQSVVDPTFNPEVVANLYGSKTVDFVHALPDGKILVFGSFNSYNRVPTGKLIRLNSDGSLDTTFNNSTITAKGTCNNGRAQMAVQPDGKIVIPCRDMVANGQPAKNLLRLNADGTLDTSFNYTLNSQVDACVLDSLGRFAIRGGFTTPQGFRVVVRLNPDGSYDNSFVYTNTLTTIAMTTQGSRVLVGDSRILRLNENGSVDSTFSLPATIGGSLSQMIVTPDNKILYVSSVIARVNENGGHDSTFQTTTIPQDGQATMRLAADGRIVVTQTSGIATFRRFLANGGADPTFTPYTHSAFSYGYDLQPDGSVIIGDYFTSTTTQGINNFIRVTPSGSLDPTFNPGGIALQNILPGSIRAIEPLPDGKVYLGGKFDVINNLSRPKVVRLNADSSVDPSFQISTTGTGNRFLSVFDVYHIRAQADGKIIVSGWFTYVQDGIQKKNLVRLNTDGAIDTTFNLTETIDDWSEIVGAGRNPVAFNDGKLMVGNSKLNGFGPVAPLKFNSNGSRDTSFNSVLHAGSPNLFIDDIRVQPDGKLLVGGSIDPSNLRSFIARLNTDGSLDSTFQYTEQPGRLRPALALLPNGKILVGKHSNGTLFGRVERLNSDGSPDASFNSLSIPNGIINALLVMPNGKIFVGGKFTVTVNGQPITNLLRLDADGTIESTAFNVNEEVLCLALDDDGRVLIGGRFTVINTNGSGGANRTYVARLTHKVLFDFDGDGKADISVFRPSENKWYVFRSSDGGVTQQVFAIPGDVAVPSDYDGDGKTDIAIYRPSSADWWSLSTLNGGQVFGHWGSDGVIPRPSDFDGDGKSDYIVYSPANSTWYRWGSTVGASNVTFGLAGDKPVTGDFDGDGVSDVAIYRPSSGEWWYAASSAGGAHRAARWGISSDIPVPADYDGDGKTDLAVYRPSNGGWYIVNSSTGSSTIVAFGLTEDKPAPADYDGDGKADLAVFRPSTGIWYLSRSTAGFSALEFGISSDVPTPNSFVQ
jgi:uncharacterized delta-60 repeat protein